jgi:hypothetical protein
MFFFCLIIVFAVLLLFSDTAYAYIDPGVGGALYQVIILIIGAIAGYFAVVKRYLKKWFGKDKDKSE